MGIHLEEVVFTFLAKIGKTANLLLVYQWFLAGFAGFAPSLNPNVTPCFKPVLAVIGRGVTETGEIGDSGRDFAMGRSKMCFILYFPETLVCLYGRPVLKTRGQILPRF